MLQLLTKSSRYEDIKKASEDQKAKDIRGDLNNNVGIKLDEDETQIMKLIILKYTSNP